MKNLLLLSLCLWLVSAAAKEAFEANAALAKTAEKRAAELVVFAETQFQVKLDYSEESIEKLDPLLDQLNLSYAEEQPPDEQIIPIAQGFGSYIGEVYRRNHSASWGWITEGEQVFPGLKQKSGGLFWPWAKALDRIKTNEKPTISDYYHFLVIR